MRLVNAPTFLPSYVALLAGSDVLNSGPTEADVLRAFETGQADGAGETQNALEADFEARINPTWARTPSRVRSGALPAPARASG